MDYHDLGIFTIKSLNLNSGNYTIFSLDQKTVLLQGFLNS